MHLVYPAGRYLFYIEARDLGQDESCKNLVEDKIEKKGYKLPEDHKWEKTNDNEWTISGENDYERFFYILKENTKLKIYADKIHGLKVKEAEEGKLKIYKRREEHLSL